MRCRRSFLYTNSHSDPVDIIFKEDSWIWKQKHTLNMAYRKLTLLVVALFVSTGAEGQTITESEPAVKRELTLEAQSGTGSDRLLEKDCSGSHLYTQLVLLSIIPSQSREDSPSPEMTPAVKSTYRWTVWRLRTQQCITVPERHSERQ